MTNVNETAPPPRGPADRVWWMAALVVGVVGLIVASILWVGGDDGDFTDPTEASTSLPVVPSAATNDSAAATSVPTTASSSSTTTASVDTTTTTTTTTVDTTTTNGTSSTDLVAPTPTEPGGPTWLVESPYVPGEHVTMARVAEAGGLSAYDGEFGVGGLQLRCIAVVADGEIGWQEWCDDAGQATRFVALYDDRPWLVEVGRLPGDIALLEQPTAWTLPSNGCAEPTATLAKIALAFESSVSPAVVTSIVCVPGEAFVGFSTVLLQPGPVDGGGALLVETDSGWKSYGPGTSYGCDGLQDGVDRCDLFGVEDELFGALRPIPSFDTIGPTDAVPGVVDRTAEVEAWVGDVTDPAAVDSIVVERLVVPDTEAPAIVRRADRLRYGSVNLLVVQIPLLDDSVGTETWAVWIGAHEETAGVRAWSWNTCARGVAEPGLCI